MWLSLENQRVPEMIPFQTDLYQTNCAPVKHIRLLSKHKDIENTLKDDKKTDPIYKFTTFQIYDKISEYSICCAELIWNSWNAQSYSIYGQSMYIMRCKQIAEEKISTGSLAFRFSCFFLPQHFTHIWKHKMLSVLTQEKNIMKHLKGNFLIEHHIQIIYVESWVEFLQGFFPINPSGRVNWGPFSFWK